jgi:hypothetical protein
LIPTFSCQILDTHGHSKFKRNILNSICKQRYITINSYRIVGLILGLVAILLPPAVTISKLGPIIVRTTQ